MVINVHNYSESQFSIHPASIDRALKGYKMIVVLLGCTKYYTKFDFQYSRYNFKKQKKSNTQLNDPRVTTGPIKVKGQFTMLVNDIFCSNTTHRSIKLKTAKGSS